MPGTNTLAAFRVAPLNGLRITQLFAGEGNFDPSLNLSRDFTSEGGPLRIDVAATGSKNSVGHAVFDVLLNQAKLGECWVWVNTPGACVAFGAFTFLVPQLDASTHHTLTLKGQLDSHFDANDTFNVTITEFLS